MSNSGGQHPQGRDERLLRWLATVSGRGRQRSPAVDRLLLAIAASVFVVAATWAWQQLPPEERSFSGGWLTFALFLALITLLLNALEFGVSAELRGFRSPTRNSWRVSVLGSAANLLPVPGAVVVRAQALRRLGERTSGAVIVTGLVGLVWVATAAVAAGLLLLTTPSHQPLGAAFLGVGATTIVGSMVVLRRGGGRMPTLVRLLTIEVASVLVSGVRLYAVARAAGLPIDPPAALTISLGGILSHVVGIFPGGLGLKELVSGAFGTLVGVSASVGVLASAIDRLVVYAALAMASVPLLLLGRAPTSGVDSAVATRDGRDRGDDR